MCGVCIHMYVHRRPEECVGCLSLHSGGHALSLGLSMSLEFVPFGLDYALVKSTYRTHPVFT